MREARLVGLSQDGTQLILAMAETGEEFAVPVDDRLRAALRGDRARLGQLEIQMESALRPRDIQARIRAGESPEAVAAVAQMPMERVMAFAGPVLAERDHIASLAQRASVRRRGGGDAPTRNLGAWVTERLRTRQVDPASAEWDAWRREDGRWAVRVSYFVESEDEAEKKDEKIAMFAYDAPGRYAVPDDDEARWLVGEQVQVLPPPVQPQPGERRLAAVMDIDPTIAPDHGADSYEAGFEDTIALRRRNHPPTREPGGYPREVARDGEPRTSVSREAAGYPREVLRERAPAPRESVGYRGEDPQEAAALESAGYAREGARARESAGRDNTRESAGREYPREVAREHSRDPERGNRRVHSVPNPDEEPTLIDVPVEQPPALRPAVRQVEPEPFTPPEETAAAPPAPVTDPRTTPDRADPDTPPAPATPSPEPAAEPAAASAEPAAAPEEAPAEPKKKPARRGKRASVPSWDEIMFGKKAD